MVSVILFINLYVLMGWFGYELYLLNKNKFNMIVLEKDCQDVDYSVVDPYTTDTSEGKDAPAL